MQHPEPHDITALAYGLIEGDERETLLTHLSECDECRGLYDSYRDEQARVRDAIVRDARSGAAEAKALESTLKMLGAIDTEASPRGRLLHLPRWVLIAEVAAMLAVAVGLFFILKPSDEPQVVPIAEELRAPAEVNDGVVYVSDYQGDWKPADALPEDEWVMAGEESQLVLTLANGSQAKIEPNCVFKLGRDGASDQLMLQFLRGNGVIDTAAMTDTMFVRSGQAGFYAMPNARFTIASELAATQLRSWTQPERVNAAVAVGDVVLWPEAAKYNKLPLKGGDKVEWTPQDFKVYTQSGKVLPVTFTYAWAQQVGAEPAFPTGFEREAGVMHHLLIELAPRIQALRERVETLPKQGDPRAMELQKYIIEFREFDEDKGFPTAMQPIAGIDDMVRIELTENHGTRVVFVHTDGVSISVNVENGRVRQSYESESIDDLMNSDVPEDLRSLLEGVKFKKNADGRIRIEGANIEGREGVNVKVISTSNRAGTKD